MAFKREKKTQNQDLLIALPSLRLMREQEFSTDLSFYKKRRFFSKTTILQWRLLGLSRCRRFRELLYVKLIYGSHTNTITHSTEPSTQPSPCNQNSWRTIIQPPARAHTHAHAQGLNRDAAGLVKGIGGADCAFSGSRRARHQRNSSERGALCSPRLLARARARLPTFRIVSRCNYSSPGGAGAGNIRSARHRAKTTRRPSLMCWCQRWSTRRLARATIVRGRGAVFTPEIRASCCCWCTGLFSPSAGFHSARAVAGGVGCSSDPTPV